MVDFKTNAEQREMEYRRQLAQRLTNEYPYQDGDTLVLGPEVFVSADRKTICWKGVNYYAKDYK